MFIVITSTASSGRWLRGYGTFTTATATFALLSHVKVVISNKSHVYRMIGTCQAVCFPKYPTTETAAAGDKLKPPRQTLRPAVSRVEHILQNIHQ